jgi:hypothetical protein
MSQLNQCLMSEAGLSPAMPEIMTVKGESAWEERVCSTSNSLDERVKVLLEALPCPQHRLCQILSPQDLRELARPDRCRQVVRDKWKKLFHKLYLVIRDFSEVFQQKFDIGDYSAAIHENQRCKVS